MFFRPKNIFVHNPVAHIQAEFSAGGVPGCKFGNFQIPGGFNRSDIAPGTETDKDNSLNIKSQLQILLSRNLLLCKDETNFEIETFNLMKDIYSDGFGNAFWWWQLCWYPWWRLWQCLMMSADFGLNSGAFEWKIWKAGVIIIVAVGRIWIKFRGLWMERLREWQIEMKMVDKIRKRRKRRGWGLSSASPSQTSLWSIIVFIMIVIVSPSNMRQTSDILAKLKALRRDFVTQSVRERIVIVVAHFSPCF